MECKMRLATNLARFELQKLGLMAIVGCFLLLSPTILAMTKPCMDSFSNWIKNMTLEEDPACHEQEMSSCRRGMNASQEEDLAGDKQRDARRNDSKLQSRSICDVSGPRSIVCEMDGDVRIHGNSSSVMWITSSSTNQRNETWQIKPYARKGDSTALCSVRELSLRSMSTRDEAPHCTFNHSIPAIIFSTGGYAGNMFHDFSDMLIPLFLTSHQYHGEVRFLITNMKPWWIKKYQQMLSHLSHYEIIDFDNGGEVHCFPHVIVGLRCHMEFNIDHSRPPTGYSMANLTQFMRSSYSLEREMMSKVREHSERKPKLLIISRKWTRSLTNTNQIVGMAKELGYEVVVMEPSLGMDMAQFARIVNSCDVMMGVHGAGLANMVFLPSNAVLIQIVPWGQLGGIARYDFGWAASNAGLKYLQYEISLEESSLLEQYPRDHPIIKDPLSVHKRGWVAVRDTFLYRQNIRLDVRRFRDVLLEALSHIHQ
ncbi:alpha-1,3-arabinosyltransferase XAT3-like [Elaeis guineensis]|uniref:Alpha-1,3-arabinosyltransferase XAT3-like isoform X1 n=2 Tax=Elaeis guineensis var. tenera TaxID=51953 RepID=A0A6I9RJ65_ELAGV|nr:alpha-1,3-arabinosyltransferase XAT3-like isoform X1 [Elaeis guineensis]